MIQLTNLTKRFGHRTAVDHLALEVSRGEIFGLLGHNGAGKSTAIGMMLGQIWPTGGEVRVCGHDVCRQREQALRRMGAIFETPAFYDYLSGKRNLEILSQYSAPTPPQRIAEVLEWVGLAGREKSRVGTYSHGMRARLALAQALLPQPELLILDEPSDGLDPEGIHEMRMTIRRLHRELSLTILLSSHFLNEVEQICTRIAVLQEGRKVFEGGIAEALGGHSWVRLRTDDFPGAVQRLRAAGLVSQDREGRLIALAEGASTAQVTRTLVQQGFPVHEIGPEERTLESFYLTLMEAERARANSGGRPAPSPEES